MKIAIDFDGVICRRVGIPSLSEPMLEMEPQDDAKEAIEYLLKLGHEVYVLTSNPDPKGVEEWLKEYEFPKLRVTNIKEPSTVYIDDRGLRFTNWQDIRKYFG